MNRQTLKGALIGVSAVALMAPAAVWAQETRPAEILDIEEITVTAQKREQRLQDVPVSAQVIGGETRLLQNVNSLELLAQTAPSVHVRGTVGRSGEFFIRGIGSGNTQSIDQSVSQFIDDVYHGHVKTTAATFLDLERVEILKGPQSTYFGNNAIAGAFNIVTKKPGSSIEGFARALYGEYGQYAAETAATLPLNDGLSVRVAGIVNGQRGWVRNRGTGHRDPDQDNLAGRVTLGFRPNSNFDATLKVEASRMRDHSSLWGQVVNCPAPAPLRSGQFCPQALELGVPIGVDQDENYTNAQGLRLNTVETALTMNYERWGHTLTSVTGYYDYDYMLDYDADNTPATLFTVQVPERYDQFSQELRVASPTGQAIEYLAGAYYQSDDLTARVIPNFYFLTPVFSSIPAFAPLLPYLPIGQDINFSQPGRTTSAFGSVTWNANEKLSLTAGLRGSWVDKDFSWNLFYGTASQTYGGLVPLPASVAPLPAALRLGTPGSLKLPRTDRDWMPSATIRYKITPAAMVYLSYSDGFKAGGFNAAESSGSPQNYPFAPEHVDAYEAGLKSAWFDNRLIFNLTAFRSDYRDLQVVVNIPSSTTGPAILLSFVRNAAESRSQGFELESQFSGTDNLRVTASATYLDAHYVSYPNAALTMLQALQAGAISQDLSGRPTAYAPKWSGSVTGTYQVRLPGEHKLTAELTGGSSSEYFFNNNDDPFVIQNGYVRVDGRLTLESADERWALDLIGKNLTDRTILTLNMPTQLWLQQKEAPRNVAVQVRYSW